VVGVVVVVVVGVVVVVVTTGSHTVRQVPPTFT
jgi:hypothetical protein